MVMIALSGCVLPGWEQEIRVVLPDLPARWMFEWGAADYELTIHAAGTAVEKRFIPAGTKETHIQIGKEGPLALLAHPVWSSGGPALARGETMAPAGAVWPDVAPDRTVELTFRHGAAATIVATLISRGVDLRAFNAERLVYEMDQRLSDDPWAVDIDYVIAKVEAREMRASFVRPRATVEPTIDIPGGGWLPWSPFAQPIDGRWVPLPYGVTRFYRGRSARMVVTVEEEETWLVVRQ